MRLPGRRSPAPVAAGYAHASPPAASTQWRAAGYCVVDLELTGLDPRRHEIISFGGVPVHDGRAEAHSAVYGLVRPTGEISHASILVHGIRAADLREAPPLDEAIGPLLQAMTGRALVVHAAQVDRAFLRPALRRLGTGLRGPVIDTSILGRLWLLERDGSAPRWLSLAALAAALELPAHSPHNALGDALTTAQAFIALASHLDSIQPETVGSLARARRRVDTRLLALAAGAGEVLGFFAYALGARHGLATTAVLASLTGAVAAALETIPFGERPRPRQAAGRRRARGRSGCAQRARRVKWRVGSLSVGQPSWRGDRAAASAARAPLRGAAPARAEG